MGDRDGVEQDSVAVPCLTLESVASDSRVDRIHLLKVDREGSEYGIFESLSPEAASRIDQIAMEVHPVPGKSPEGLRSALEALGFDVARGYTWFAIYRNRPSH